MHKAGFIIIIGNPNVGKSTLMNCLVGEKLSIITSKAQTTRHRILGIVNGDNFQLIISDTPGIIKPSYELQSSMMDFVKSALEDADVLVYMLEIGEKSIRDIEVHNKINNAKVPVIRLYAADGMRTVFVPVVLIIFFREYRPGQIRDQLFFYAHRTAAGTAASMWAGECFMEI